MRLSAVQRWVAGGLLTVMLSCGSPPDRIGDLDLVQWRQDRGGCQNVRPGLINALKAVREELKGESANELGKLLGRPDVDQLADRNQKYYIYFLEPGIHCRDPKKRSASRSVAFRISAIGLVTEITFQRGQP